MQQSRKKFLVTGAMSLAGTMFLSKKLLAGTTLFSDKNSHILGLQLYSVRDDMKNDPAGTLQKLAAMGYKYVEHANYTDGKFYGYTPIEFKKLLDGLGLQMPSGHTELSDTDWETSSHDFTDKWKQTVADAATIGQIYVISPWLNENLRKNYNDLLGFLDIFNKSGELCKKSGLQFGYHNHDFEFKYSLNGKQIYDIILDNTDPALVIQQIDIGNMYGAGGRALEIIKKHPGRFRSMHVKDEIKAAGKGEMNDNYDSTILGQGLLPIKEILDLASRIGGTTEYIIEQESYQDKTPLECAKQDFLIMQKWGY